MLDDNGSLKDHTLLEKYPAYTTYGPIAIYAI